MLAKVVVVGLLVAAHAIAISKQQPALRKSGEVAEQQSQARRAIRITIAIVRQPNVQENNEQLRARLQHIANVCRQFLSKTLSVHPVQRPLKAPARCADFQPPKQDQLIGIANSDLHIYVLARFLKGQSFVATGKSCSYAAGSGGFPDRLMARGRPVVGRLIVNTKQLATETTAESTASFIASVLHEIIHILGFDRNLFHTYLDSTTHQPYGWNITEEVVLNQKRNASVLLKTPKVVQWVKDYFGCDSITGAQLENEGSSSSQGSHWQRSVFYDELMTATTLGSDKHLSGLTFALLEDMGWYDVKQLSKKPGLTFGNQKGCEFYNDVCYSPQAFTQFCTADKILCSEDRLSKTVCMNKKTYSDGCGIRVPYQTCLFPPKNSQVLESYSSEARCFQSDLAADVKIHNLPAKCYSFQPVRSSEGYSSLTVIAQKIFCWNTQAGMNRTVDGYFGGVLCLKFEELQTPTLHCRNWCSGNGICYAGVCHCYGNYSGEDCSMECPQRHYYYAERGSCLSECPSGYFENTYDRTCHSCGQCINSQEDAADCGGCSNIKKCGVWCEQCSSEAYCIRCEAEKYIRKGDNQTICVLNCSPGTFVSNMSCESCYLGCSACSGAGRQECLSCLKGRFFYKGVCLLVCPPGTYAQTDRCYPCPSGCSSCDGHHCLQCQSPMRLDPLGNCISRCQAPLPASPTQQTCSTSSSQPLLALTLLSAIFLMCPSPKLLIINVAEEEHQGVHHLHGPEVG